MIELPAEFIRRMKERLGENYAAFSERYRSDTPERAIRVNTLKLSAEEFEKISPLALDGKVPWEENGYYVKGEGLGKTVLHAAGAYYVQEPSAMCAVPELKAGAGERVLDLCAAPGGKTTQIAAAMGGQGILFANEIDRKRCDVLKSNLERMGVKNAVVTNQPPASLAEKFPLYFDKILVDAPCSGEGMFRKEPNAVPEWSTENVRRCAARQKDILACADRMLAGRGRLVYSTCTFAPEEDEEQIATFCKEHSDYVLLNKKKLYPHEVRGEGHFCAVLQKSAGERNFFRLYEEKAGKRMQNRLNLYRAWEEETLTVRLDPILSYGSETDLFVALDGLPETAAELSGSFKGVRLGGTSADGKRFEPHHRLAMCLKADEVRHIEVDEATALQYLRGMTFACDGDQKGWRVVTYQGLPLGWCKAVGGTAKNHLPKGLRI